MKTILIISAVALLNLLSSQTGNPLRNTRWEAPNGLIVAFNSTDTVKLIMENKVINAAQYKVRDTVVIWRDFVSSDATCDTAIRGTYVYKIKDSLLSFKAISDRCEERADVLQTLVLARD